MVASISATARVSSPVTSVRRAGAARSTAVRLAPSTGRPAQRQVFTFATDEKARDRSAEDAARYKFERVIASPPHRLHLSIRPTPIARPCVTLLVLPRWARAHGPAPLLSLQSIVLS